jgi:precorrin-3B C17-methyltransferase
MKIFVVGIGPGDEKNLTPQAKEAILCCDVIVGYDLYVDLIKPLTEGKKTVTTPMKKEVDRCKAAVDFALDGYTVAMVCSGDAGVYGMAGVMHEVASPYKEIEIVVVPGITAACSAAAVLGAPLIHDFSIISLSDLLTPWEKIEKRLLLASEADFVICLYNPQSKKRSDYLQKACDIMLVHKSPSTPCGFVKNIGRDGQTATLCRLDELGKQDVDMFTTVIIGNSQTEIIGGKLVTPRGYKGI